MLNGVILFVASFFIATSAFAKSSPQQLSDDSPDWNQMVERNLVELSYDDRFQIRTSEMSHMRWVAKASLFLRGRKPISFEHDDIGALKIMSKEEVVEHFLKETNFYNSLLDFSLYFVGFKADQLIDLNGEIVSEIFGYAQAIEAVQAVSRGDSFDGLFPDESLQYVPPFGEVDLSVSETLRLPKEFDLLTSDLERRIFVFDYALEKTKEFETLGDESLKKIENEICTFYYNLYEPFTLTPNQRPVLNRLGLPDGLPQKAQALFKTPESFFALSFCAFSIESGGFKFEIPELDEFKSFIPGALTYFEELKRLSRIFDGSTYQARNVTDIRALDKTYEKELHFQSPNISQHLQNSSTNMNRKRGAYILKRFFCDDLTPVDVEIPSSHTTGSHGSNPSCFACHYKLDPMAGFFKNYGFGFTDYDGQETIFFDDGFAQNLAEYQEQWRKPNSSSDWQIGYIKSTKQDHLNAYGEDLRDLNQILRESPEVKRCMTKRLLQFSTDSSQLFDPGYVDELAQDYLSLEKSSPLIALKRLFKSVALSKSFSSDNRIYSECYDFASGISGNRPPCEVAHIIETSCKGCHQSVQGINSLDLSQWVLLEDGEFGFPHIDESTGLQHAPAVSFQKMLERITTTDSQKRMPLGSDMDPVYRQILYKWLNEKVR